MQNIIQSNPLVSVVIATFNMGQYLPTAIFSILNQTYQNLEIIIIDDGSNDDTKDAITDLLKDKRITYIFQNNSGQTIAKNKGLSLATGEYIGFCDADDFWEQDKLEKQLPYFSDPNVGVVYSEISNIDDKDNRYINPDHEIRHSGHVTPMMMIENFVPFGTAIIRRECLTHNGGFDENFKMGIDWQLWLRYSLHWTFAYCPSKTYVYRIWPGQMSNNYRGRYQNAYRILTQFIETHKNQLPALWINHAWADMYIKEANTYWRREGKIFESLKLLLKGIYLHPSRLYGWKSLAKFLIGRNK